MKKILCAFDGSEHAERAAEQAADLAKRYGAQLSLVYVVEPYVPPIDVPVTSPVDVIEPHRAAAAQLLDAEAARLAEPAGSRPRTEVRVGSAPHELVEAAREWGADLVVVGSRGHGAVKRFLLGSVADRVAHLAPSPVLVVR